MDNYKLERIILLGFIILFVLVLIGFALYLFYNGSRCIEQPIFYYQNLTNTTCFCVSPQYPIALNP